MPKTERKQARWKNGLIILVAAVCILFWGLAAAIMAWAEVSGNLASGTLDLDDSSGSISYSVDYASENASSAGSSSASISGSTFTITAADGYTTTSSGCSSTTTYYSTTVTVTFTNDTGSVVAVSYTAATSSGSGSFSSSGGTMTLEAGGTGTITLTSGGSSSGSTSGSSSTTGTITISSIAAVSTTYVTFGVNDDDYESAGSISGTLSDETEIEVGTAYEMEADATFTVEAAAEDGYAFLWWEDGDGNVLSTDASYTGQGGASEDYTVTAVFALEDTALYYIASVGTGKMYYFLDDAIEAAGSSGTIVVYGTDSTSSPTTGTVYGSEDQTEFTIPSGVTLLLPYDQDDLDLGGNFGESSEDAYSNVNFTDSYGSTGWVGCLEVNTSAVLQLTVPSGTSITVSGALVVGGTVNAQANTPCGATRGAHANLVLSEGSSLIISSSGVLSTCGFILGDGTLKCEEGSVSYQPLVILDFLGGGYTMGAGGSPVADSLGTIYSAVLDGMGYLVDPVSGEDYIMPFIRYAVQNIQADVDMVEGAVMYAYCDLYAEDTHNTTIGALIGSQSVDGLITLSDGASLHAEYDADKAIDEYEVIGRLDITVTGGASLGSLSFNVEYDLKIATVTATVYTAYYNFTLPYNFGISLEAEEGETAEYSINNSFAILPGATLTVGEGATLNVGTSSSINFLIYDGLDEYTCTSSSTSYSSTHTGSTSNNDYPTTSQLQEEGFSRCGELIVNGTLNIGSKSTFAGLVQTAGEGKIIVDDSATLSYTAQVGLVGSGSGSYSGATVYDLTAQIVSAFTGEETSMVAGTTYYGVSGEYTDESYTYTLYSNYEYTDPEDDDASSYIVSYTDETEQSIIGAWYSTAVSVYEAGTFTGLASDAAETLYFAAGDSLATLVEAYSGTGLYTSYEDSGLSGAVESTATIDDLGGITALYTASPEFAICYDSNGGSGTMETQYYALDATEVTLTENAFAGVTGEFQGWALSSSAEEATLEDGWSGTAAALESALQAEDSTFALSDGLTITLYAVWGSEEVISVTVVWGEMDYTYESDSEYVWDGSTLMYTLVEDEDAGWTSDSSTISVINGSESSPVSVSISYENTTLGSSFGLVMTFADLSETALGSIFSSETDSASISSLPAGATAVIDADLSGTPSGSGTGAELGTVTVTIRSAGE